MKYFSVLILLVLCTTLQAQNDCSDVKKAQILTNSFQCQWQFFELKDTVQAIVIRHEKAYVPCAFKTSASVTILQSGNDTFRVIDVCNLETYKIGAKVRVSAISTPHYKVSIPTYFYKDATKNTYVYRCNEYDETVLRTTWGHITVPTPKLKTTSSKARKDVVKSHFLRNVVRTSGSFSLTSMNRENLMFALNLLHFGIIYHDFELWNK